MKFKLVYSQFNPETGTSEVGIATDLGIFTGYAHLHPDDKDKASSFCGCRYAELRAMIKYIKKRISIYNHKIQAFNDYIKYAKTRKDFKEEEYFKLYKYINKIKSEKQFWKEKQKGLEDAIKHNIEERDATLVKLNKIHFKG